MQVIRCPGQCSSMFQQPAGRVMCTTACLHFAVAFLTGQICDSTPCLMQKVISIMKASSISHGSSGMLSAFEVLKKVDTKKLGIHVEERACLLASGGNKKRSRDDFFIHGIYKLEGELKDCASRGRNGRAAMVATWNGHSICTCFSRETNRFCFFDSLPSHLSFFESGMHKLLEDSLQLRGASEQSLLDATFFYIE